MFQERGEFCKTSCCNKIVTTGAGLLCFGARPVRRSIRLLISHFLGSLGGLLLGWPAGTLVSGSSGGKMG